MRATLSARLIVLIALATLLPGQSKTRAAEVAPPVTATNAGPRLCFLQAVPDDQRAAIADDIKLLIGWTFDAYAAERRYQGGEIVDRTSGFTEVPGFAAPTPMQDLGGRYRLVQPPFDRGRGYYGLLFAALDARSRPVALILTNRLFRAPVMLQQPVGLATDLLTNAALAFDLNTDGVVDALAAAESAYAEAAMRDVPLILSGQSQAGATAQLQAAKLQKTHGGRPVPSGFISLNAAEALFSVRGLGLDADRIDGVNFSKDYDPAFGPHALLANAVGRQIYVHPDGTAGAAPGTSTLFDALLHPREHLLDTFTKVSLAAGLKPVLAAAPKCTQPAATGSKGTDR